jgi:hypothetical protein
MNIKIVNLVAEFKFGILLIEKRRKLILFSAIQSSPVIIRL